MENRDDKAFFGGVKDQKIVKEDEEEGKIEKFFELIRNLREARKGLVVRREIVETIGGDNHILVSENQKNKINKNKNNNNNNNNNKRRKTTEIKWVPSESYNNYSFEKEDFTADVGFRGTPLIFPEPCNITTKRHVHVHVHVHKEELADGLDLNLKL